MTDSSRIRLAETYLHTQLAPNTPPPSGPAQPAGPFITVSRQTGTGGLAFAEAVAARLRREAATSAWAVYSGNIIQQMLFANKLPGHLARFLPEDRLPQIESSIGEIVGLHPDLWTLVDKTNEAMRQLARDGGAILVGRGANFATTGISRGVHVRLVAPESARAERTARLRSLDPDAAAAHNAQVDAARKRYVSATFDADIADPAAYDFVLNLGRVRFDDAVDITVRAALAGLGPTAAKPELHAVGHD